ncbi:hypothetical protein ACFX5D_14675 [Flavobacterium sp. LB3P45]|uniref:Uncharacterized protein n=1 Tax=Flavobacterium fructosi TaxID=3230416 RepID=A0ABW6HQ88_9FLAO
MKKILLTIAITLYFGNANSQINNLSDLLQVSELSVFGLTENLQHTWEISKPFEGYSKDKKKIINRYTYSYFKDKRNQILHRNITVGLETDYRSEITEFVCNDLELQKLILKNLPYQGFELKEKKGDKSVYEDGNRKVTIDSNQLTTGLAKGYYLVSVELNYIQNSGN